VMYFERLISEDRMVGSPESLSPAVLWLLALPIPIGDGGWLLWGLFQASDRFFQ